LKLVGTLRSNRMGRALCAAVALATFVAIAVFRVPLVWVIAGLGSLAVALAWMRLGS